MILPLLTLLLCPFISALMVLLLPIPPKRIKSISVSLSALPFLLLIVNHSGWINSYVNYPWLPELGLHFDLNIDKLSLIFLYLTACVVPMSIVACTPLSSLFYGLVLLLQGLLLGFFMAADLLLLTLFWEAMLLPLYFIIYLGGTGNAPSAAAKFLLYMLTGSMFMIAAVLALYFNPLNEAATLNIALLTQSAEQVAYAPLIAFIFLLAFAVKAPLFPFHGWLPDAYTSAPLPGTILLSAILSKAGIYGILKIAIPFFPSLMHAWAPWLLSLSIFGVLYGALMAWTQNNFKRLLAYSSFSHVNFILVGLFLSGELAHTGALLQVINHAVIITGLFLVAFYLEQAIQTRSILDLNGVASSFPRLCWITLFFALAAMAVPGTNNFIGEFFIFFALFKEYPWLTPLLGLSLIFSAVYMLRWMQKSFFGPQSHQNWRHPDLNIEQILILMPLILLILWIGIHPSPFIEVIQ